MGIAIITIVKKKKKRKRQSQNKQKQTVESRRAEKINHRTKRPAMNLSGANTNKGGNFELRKRMGEHWPELELRLYYERRYRRHIYEILLIPFFY